MTAIELPYVSRATLEAGARLGEAEAVFRKWLGEGYDIDAMRATLAVAAVQQLDGDPLWLLVISGPGNAKTETVAALSGAGAVVASTLTGEAALLSATSRKEKAVDATGGLLRVIGDSGILVLKDVTSILSMNRDRRAEVLSALREVYDGSWTRHVGAEGGRTLHWSGRLVVVGAVTTAWDSAHGVIAAMGDRFALLRVDSTKGRLASGRQALDNVGSEPRMRAELAEAVAKVMASVSNPGSVDHNTAEELLVAADLVTTARTAVERDFRGDPIEAHAPEAPTRFAKQLAQVVRGATAIGLDPAAARALALRVAADSVPPLRLAVLRDVAGHPLSTCADVVERQQKPRNTVDRTLQSLHLLGLVKMHTSKGTGWRYTFPDREVPEMSKQPFSLLLREGKDISGQQFEL